VRFGLVAGLLIGGLFTLPFAFIVKSEQLHVVAAGAALVLTSAAAGVLEAISKRRLVMAAAGVAVAAGLASMAVVTRNITRDFEPFGPIVLHNDRIVEEWAAVPAEVRDYLASKRAPGADGRLDTNPARALPSVAFGMHGFERSPDGISLRWMAGPQADIFIRRGMRLVSFPIRHERGAFGEAARVRIEADGRVVSDMTLDDGRWHRIDVSLRRRAWTGLTGMHRITVALDHAWIPAKVIPGSGDRRLLGLQIGVIETR
jgi:hypothetical protein